MKTNFTKAVLIAASVLLSGSAFAQSTSTGDSQYVQPFSPTSSFRTWSVGVNGGLLTPYTIFRGSKEDFIHPKSELGYGAYIKDQLFHTFGLQLSYLRGKISGNQAQDPAYTYYTTQLKSAFDLSGNFTFANINWHNQENVIQPYVTAGAGFSWYQPTFGRSAGAPITVDHNIKNMYIPLGIGIKFALGSDINLDLGYQVNFVDGDNLDAYNYGDHNDKFSYAHIGLEFALGPKSKPQLARHNPVASMRHEYIVSEEKLQSELDAQKAQNDQLKNDLDATKASLATTNANLAKFTADADGDGVPDFFDKCPGTPAGTKVDGSGCPLPAAQTKVIVTEEDRRIVREAIKNLEFDFGKATIRAHSYPTLERVAKLLVDKNFSLKLAGHTDNVGSDAANLRLSKDRAESVKSFLVSKGANPSRIEATGYGETQPIATNKTAKGRQMNRRVEFTLY